MWLRSGRFQKYLVDVHMFARQAKLLQVVSQNEVQQVVEKLTKILKNKDALELGFLSAMTAFSLEDL